MHGLQYTSNSNTEDMASLQFVPRHHIPGPVKEETQECDCRNTTRGAFKAYVFFFFSMILHDFLWKENFRMYFRVAENTCHMLTFEVIQESSE